MSESGRWKYSKLACSFPSSGRLWSPRETYDSSYVVHTYISDRSLQVGGQLYVFAGVGDKEGMERVRVVDEII